MPSRCPHIALTLPSCPHCALTLPSHCRDLDPSHLRAPHALMLGPRRGHAEGLCACPRVIGPLRRPPCGEREGSRIKSARASRGVKRHRTGCPPRKGRLTKWPGPTKWPRVQVVQVRARRALRAPHVPVTCGARTPYVRRTNSYVRRTNSVRAAHQLRTCGAPTPCTCGARGFTRARTSARCARTCASLCAPAVARAPRQRPLERDGRSARSPWPAGYILAKHRRICGFHTRPSYSHRADHPHRAGRPST
jgi:hypothetical protein